MIFGLFKRSSLWLKTQLLLTPKNIFVIFFVIFFFLRNVVDLIGWLKIFGSKNHLPNKILEIFEKIEKDSADNKKLNLNIAFNYGFKDEIRNILKNIIKKESNINLDNQKNIDNLFFLGQIPDPDILIRTGGYKRLSNFIMYNLTYTELFFTDTLWPDFSEKEFNDIINEYLNIRRKYGL